jgi:hypothetical protein
MGYELSSHPNCLLLGMGRPAIPSRDDTQPYAGKLALCSFDSCAGRPPLKKLAMPHASFIKFHAAKLPRCSSLEGAMIRHGFSRRVSDLWHLPRKRPTVSFAKPPTATNTATHKNNGR